MATKFVRRAVPLESLVVDFDLNNRLKTNYDLPEMKDGIFQRGQIDEALKVEEFGQNGSTKFKVLQGNRRTLSAQEIVAWLASAKDLDKVMVGKEAWGALDEKDRAGKYPYTPEQLRASLEKLQCDVYKDLTETERDELVGDDGGKKELNSAEFVLMIWKFASRGYQFHDLVAKHFEGFRRYSKNNEQAKKVREEKDESKRKQITRLWLQPILEDYILGGQACGQLVRDQIIIQEMKNDGWDEKTWPEEYQGKFLFEVKPRTRIKELRKEREADIKANEWDWKLDTGPRFRKKIEDFINADKEPPAAPSVKPWAKKEMREKAGSMSSEAVKFTLLRAAGETGENGEEICNLFELDKEAARQEHVKAFLVSVLDETKDEKIKNLLRAIAYNKPETVEKYLKLL